MRLKKLLKNNNNNNGKHLCLPFQITNYRPPKSDHMAVPFHLAWYDCNNTGLISFSKKIKWQTKPGSSYLCVSDGTISIRSFGLNSRALSMNLFARAARIPNGGFSPITWPQRKAKIVLGVKNKAGSWCHIQVKTICYQFWSCWQFIWLDCHPIPCLKIKVNLEKQRHKTLHVSFSLAYHHTTIKLESIDVLTEPLKHSMLNHCYDFTNFCVKYNSALSIDPRNNTNFPKVNNHKMAYQIE